MRASIASCVVAWALAAASGCPAETGGNRDAADGGDDAAAPDPSPDAGGDAAAADPSPDASDDGSADPNGVDLQACRIEGSAEGTPLGDPPRALAGSQVTLTASDGCDDRLELAWFHGAAPDDTFWSSERAITFQLYGRDYFELRVSDEDGARLVRSIVVEATPTEVAASLLVEPIKPRSHQQAMATVSAIQSGMYVPIVEVESVASVDFELTALDDRFMPGETVLSASAQTTSVWVIPPQAIGWYEVRAIARGADGSIQGTPLPARFEVVP